MQERAGTQAPPLARDLGVGAIHELPVQKWYGSVNAKVCARRAGIQALLLAKDLGVGAIHELPEPGTI